MGNGNWFASTPHHVGLVVGDLTAAMNAYIEDFGYTFFQFEVNERNAALSGSSASFSLRFGIGQFGLNLIELIQPLSGTTIYSQHLTQRGPGLHHLAFSVSDLNAARQQLAARGYPCLQDGAIRGFVNFSYFEAQGMACIVEPLQLSADLLAFLAQSAETYLPKPR